jgi:hypothetical protein
MSNNRLNIFTVGSFKAVFFKERTEKIHSNQFVISLKNLFESGMNLMVFLFIIEKQLFCLTAFETLQRTVDFIDFIL